MIDVVQKLVEDLAQQLHRSVTVDDASFNLIASSAHFEDEDPARVSSLLTRRVAGASLQYLLDTGIMTWRGLHRMAPNPSVGAEKGRLCYPLRSRYELLGFMTIIDDGDTSDEDLAAIEISAQQLARAMARRVKSRDDEELEIQALTLSLLSSSASDRAHAARELRDFGLFRGANHFGAIVVSVPDAPETDTDESPDDVVRRAVRNATRTVTPLTYAYATSDTDSYVVVGQRPVPSSAALHRLASLVHNELGRPNPALGSAPTIGIGAVQSQLENTFISADQAVNAIRVARSNGQSVAAWGDDPLSTLLGALLQSEYSQQILPRALRIIDAEPEDTKLLIETYLNHAANVAKTADELHVHRTTIYYRLSRFQEVTGLDLDDGQARLLVHLWLRSRSFCRAV